MSEPKVYRASAAASWDAVAQRWDAIYATLKAATPFQSFAWLDSWYRTQLREAEITPLLIEVYCAASGALAALMPMVIVRRGSMRVLQFVDSELSDYNAPVLGPASPTNATDTRAFWQAVERILGNVDLLDLRKMPPELGGKPNPFVLLGGTHPSTLNGNIIQLADSFEGYRRGLKKHDRQDNERCWRILQEQEPECRFQRVTTVTAAYDLLDEIDRQQRARFDETGDVFKLDRPANRAFYRRLVDRGLASGAVIMTKLEARGVAVASLYAVADGDTLIVLRIANAGEPWGRAAPGRLIVYRTIELAIEIGFKSVDLSIGNYGYKKRLGAVPTPLIDWVAPRSWRGKAAGLKTQAVVSLRSYPALDATLRRMVGKKYHAKAS